MFHKLFSDLEQGFWQFGCETRILFAPGQGAERLDRLADGRVGFLTDAGVSGLRFTRQAREALGGRLVAEERIGFESDVADIGAAIRLFNKRQVTMIVAVGGGSVLDAAKVVAALLPNEIEPMVLKGVSSLPVLPVPLVTMPTTFGTGAEVNQYAHVNDRASDHKIGLKKSWLTPTYALIDPEVMYETPQLLRHLAGIDAWVHLFEVLTLARERSPLGDLLMRHGLALCENNLKGCVHSPNPENTSAIALASLLGGIGIHNARTGLIHTLAIPYARRTGAGHVSSLLPFIMPAIAYNWDHISSLFEHATFDAFRERLLERVLFDEVERGHLPRELAAETESMAEACAADTVLLKENRRPLDRQSFVSLYGTALGVPVR